MLDSRYVVLWSHERYGTSKFSDRNEIFKYATKFEKITVFKTYYLVSVSQKIYIM